MLGLLDQAASAAVEAERWPRRRVYQLGEKQLYAACEGATGKNAKKALRALDAPARAAAAALISSLGADPSLADLALAVPSVTLLLLPP